MAALVCSYCGADIDEAREGDLTEGPEPFCSEACMDAAQDEALE